VIRVITIDREYGAGGAEIASALARHLGWNLWDQLLTNEIARLMECDCRAVEEHEEKRDSLYYRLLKGFLRGSYEGSVQAPHAKIIDTEFSSTHHSKKRSGDSMREARARRKRCSLRKRLTATAPPSSCSTLGSSGRIAAAFT
jgi:hypothetical protein